jgi:hypothetical protein
MAREIKFRAWNGLYMTTSGIMFSSTDGEIFTAANMPVMQFTGLHDKNGKEIYEGDIVRYNHSVAQYNFPLIYVAKVVYWNEHCKFRLEGNNSTDLHEDIFWSEIEVIGNIWENPELLKIEDLIDQVENPY